jgi:CDP-6-deoxy-D-xylo-4-hexulose-3-dehydrase
MILTYDLELAHLCRCLRSHGWTLYIPSDSPIYHSQNSDFYEAYRFILPGYNVRPLEISAAVGRQQLKKLPLFTQKRRENLKLFQSLFADDPRFIIQKENGKSSSFSFTIIIDPKYNLDRQRIFSALEKSDIGYRIITGGNFLRHDVIKYYDCDIVGGSTPNANIAHDHGFFVGNHPYDLAPQIRKLYDTLDSSCR